MIGLVIAGPWLTTALARWCGRVLGGRASGLLASRRLADDPKAAFRAVRGLVLAVFLGTIVGALVPLLDSLIATPNSTVLSPTCCSTRSPRSSRPPSRRPASRGSRPMGLTPQAGAALVSGLQGLGGTTVYPLYSLPQAANPNSQGNYIGVVSCSALRQLAVLGQCAPGAQAVQVNDNSLIFSDNPHDSTAAFVSAANPAYTGSLAPLPLQAVLVRVDSAGTLERVRTYLAIHAPPQVSAGPGVAATPPRTYRRGGHDQVRPGRGDAAAGRTSR